MSDPRSMVLDLFAGTGSATLPFRECGKHTVVGVDIVPGPYVEIVCDVRKLPRWVRETKWDFVWSSPPCQQFSVGNIHNRDPVEAMKLVRESRELMGEAPKWVIENVRGAVPYMVGFDYVTSAGAFWLWSNIDLGDLPAFHKGAKMRQSHFKQHHDRGTWYLAKYTNPRPHSERIPRPLAEAVHRAVCEA